jgi:hypothetical protein
MGGIWGLLGPGQLSSVRRVRALGLAAAVRRFNELAVPGLGGVWYGKRLLLATLGLAAAEQARAAGAKVHNIEVANAVEALACCLAFQSQGWQPDARLRGREKLLGKVTDLSFDQVRRRGFYVSQPMRMATVQALPALGFVEGGVARFNAFQCSAEGKSFVEEACRSHAPRNRSVTAHLVKWIRGEEKDPVTTALRDALSPLAALSASTQAQLRTRLELGGRDESPDSRSRRRSALNWVGRMTAGPATWRRPAEITDDAHWRDLQAGAAFSAARDAALAALDALEGHMGSTEVRTCTVANAAVQVAAHLETLKREADRFLSHEQGDADASRFCQECSADDPVQVLRSLVQRDGRVLCLSGDTIRPAGSAFRGVLVEPGPADEDDDGIVGGVPVPPGISYRMRNLYLLHLDMTGQLDAWLARNRQEVIREA